MPARFAVGQGSAAQRTPNAPCQRQGSVIRRIKGNKSAFFRIPSQERSDTVQRTRPIVKDKATHPVHARVLPGQGSAVQRTSSAQEPFVKGMTCEPAASPARISPGRRHAASCTPSAPCQGCGHAVQRKIPVFQAQTASKIWPGEYTTARGIRHRPRALETSRPPPQDAKDRTRRARILPG